MNAATRRRSPYLPMPHQEGVPGGCSCPAAAPPQPAAQLEPRLPQWEGPSWRAYTSTPLAHPGGILRPHASTWSALFLYATYKYIADRESSIPTRKPISIGTSR